VEDSDPLWERGGCGSAGEEVTPPNQEPNMKSSRHIAIAVALLMATHAGQGAAQSVQGDPNRELEAIFARYAEANELFYDGKPDAVKELWSHGDNVTLSGAAGGETAKGGRTSVKGFPGPALSSPKDRRQSSLSKRP